MDRSNDQAKKPEPAQEEGGWQYKPADTAPSPQPSDSQPPAFINTEDSAPGPDLPVGDDEVEWTASEFVAHDKNAAWYALLLLAALGIAGVIYLLTKDVFSTLMVLVLAIIFAVAAGRKPRVLTYRLDNRGVAAGTRFRPYSDFKSFALLEEGPFANVVFVPMARFGVPFSVYIAPEDEERVIEVLSRHLPLERGKLDGIDQFMRKVRF